MSNEWQGYDLADFPELSDPEDTIREALRDTIGDGEGIDEAVMRKFKSKIKADALREASTAWKQGGWVKMLSRIGPNGGRWEASGFAGDWLLALADRIEEEP